MERVKVTIVSFAPVDLSICRSCVIVGQSAGVDLRIKMAPDDDSKKLAIFLEELASRARVVAELVLPTSLRGLALMARHGGKLPLILVNGRKIHGGPIQDPADLAERALKAIWTS